MSMSGDEVYGDAVYEDQPADEQALAEELDEDRFEEDPLDGDPLDRPQRLRSGRLPTTTEEEREGESLDQRLAEEEPDASLDEEWTDEEQPEDFDEELPEAGRLVAPDEGAGPDDEPDAVAREAGVDPAAPAEEVAVHITDAPDFR